MNRIYKLTCIVLLAIASLCVTPVAAQDGTPVSAQAGTEYYVGFMQNDDIAGGAYAKFMGVMITSQVATVGIVEIPGFDSKPFSTRPGAFTSIPIPRGFEHTISEDTIGNGTESIIAGIRITSRAPVTVYVINARHQSTSGYAAVPVSLWGTRYLPVALPNGLGARTSELMIVAAYDDTYIRFTPSVTTVRQDRGVPREIKLDRGRTYFVQALAGQAGIADLSGSEIVSTRPVGVITGHVRTPITRDGSVPSDPQAYATHQSAMMLPDSAWGREFVSAPMRSGGDRFRVMPSRAAEIIVTHYGPAGVGRDTLALDAGEVRDVFTVDGHPINGATHWQSTAPAHVVQMRTSGRYGDPLESPAMLPLTSVDRLSTRTAFVAPDQIAGGVFTTHTLTLIARVPTRFLSNPADAYREITIDGKPIEAFATNGAPAPIGSTGLFYASVPVASGGHVVSGDAGVSFLGYVGGDNGTTHRDSYIWNLPWWGQPNDVDASAPYVLSTDSKTRGTVRVFVSDRTDGYFSGVGDIDVAAGNNGWVRVSYSEPYPDDDVDATFRAVADPSGPLTVTLRDRDGNSKDTVLHESICFKTATPSEREITITTPVGTVGTATLDLVANECGDEAHANAVVFGSGIIAVYLNARFDNGTTSTVIAPRGRAPLTVSSSASVPVGTYETTMRIAVDDSVLTVRVHVIVEPPSSAPVESVSSLALRVYPNPTSSRATIAITGALTAGATITITDNLGRVVRTLDPTASAGTSPIVWDGRDNVGASLPSGVYRVVVTDGSATAAHNISIVR